MRESPPPRSPSSPASQASQSVAVLLVDANPLVLSALSEVFEKDPRFSLVATTGTGSGALRLVGRVRADVAVIDWHLPDMSGPQLLESLRAHNEAPRIVAYGTGAPDIARMTLAAGAAAFVSRSARAEELMTSCLDVAAGKMVFPFIDIRDLHRDPLSSLSRRERALLESLATGMTNKDLAKAFGISINTVKFHLSNLYDKLGVRSRTQAIAFYFASRHPN